MILVFSNPFWTLVKIALAGKITAPVDGIVDWSVSSIDLLGEARLIQNVYTGFQKEVVLTSSGRDYLVNVKKASWESLNIDPQGAFFVLKYLVLSLQIRNSKLLDNIKIMYLGLLLSNPFRLTFRGQAFIDFYVAKYPDVIVKQSSSYYRPWLRNFILKNISEDDWAWLLSNLRPEEASVWAESLRDKQ